MTQATFGTTIACRVEVAGRQFTMDYGNVRAGEVSQAIRGERKDNVKAMTWNRKKGSKTTRGTLRIVVADAEAFEGRRMVSIKAQNVEKALETAIANGDI